MGLKDFFLRLLQDYFVYIHVIGVPLSYLFGNKRGTEFRNMLMAQYFDMCSPGHQALVLKLKTTAYGEIKNGKHDQSNPLRVLEIGAGAGTNFGYYPENTELSIVDPNEAFHHLIVQHTKKFSNIKLQAIYSFPAEEMSGIESNSMDAVLTSDVLCSVTDIPRVLEEIHRILKPGGTYYFAEHCLDHKESRILSIQTFLTKYRIWPFYFCGCEFRDIRKALESSVFGKRNVMAECGYNEMPENQHWLDFRLCSPYCYGKAIARE